MKLRQLFRVLVPTWRFFDDVAWNPVLWIQASTDGVAFTPWENAIPKAGPRHWGKLLLNAREIDLFARHSLVDQLVDDLEARSPSTVSLELVGNLADFRVRENYPTATHFLFKVTVGPDEAYRSEIRRTR